MSEFSITLNPLDVLGISLAVLDFTGLTRHLEAALAKYRHYERNSAKEMLAERDIAFRFRELYSAKRIWKDLTDKLVIIAAGFAFVLFTAYFFGDINKLWGLFAQIPVVVWFSLIWIIPILWILVHFLEQVLGFTVAYFLSMAIWSVLWVLSRPKTGIVGTIGVIITLLGSGGGIVSGIQSS